MVGEESYVNDAAGEPEEQSGQAAQEVVAAHELVKLSYAEYEELKTLAEERDYYLKRLQRAVADYQNLQKRMDRFREAAYEATLRSLIAPLLPIADSLARALDAAQKVEGAQDIVEGLRLVEKEFYGALETFGIRPMQVVGQPFDPHCHEAAIQEDVAGVAPNTVVRELKRGFVLGDAVIRPSQVVVARGRQVQGQTESPAAKQPESTSELP